MTKKVGCEGKNFPGARRLGNYPFLTPFVEIKSQSSREGPREQFWATFLTQRAIACMGERWSTSCKRSPIRNKRDPGPETDLWEVIPRFRPIVGFG